MQFVYLAHPFISNPTYNIQRVNKIAREIIETQINQLGKLEYIPFVPHNILSVFSEANNPNLRPITEEISRRMVNFCSQLWISSATISDGMLIEIEIAKQKRILIIPYSEIIERFNIDKL